MDALFILAAFGAGFLISAVIYIIIALITTWAVKLPKREYVQKNEEVKEIPEKRDEQINTDNKETSNYTGDLNKINKRLDTIVALLNNNEDFSERRIYPRRGRME